MHQLPKIERFGATRRRDRQREDPCRSIIRNEGSERRSTGVRIAIGAATQSIWQPNAGQLFFSCRFEGHEGDANLRGCFASSRLPKSLSTSLAILRSSLNLTLVATSY